MPAYNHLEPKPFCIDSSRLVLRPLATCKARSACQRKSALLQPPKVTLYDASGSFAPLNAHALGSKMRGLESVDSFCVGFRVWERFLVRV